MRKFLDFILISIFGFREGENHIPNAKLASIFNGTGTTERPFILYVFRK